MKPMLASDAVEEKIAFPCIAQPKIDGVRALHTEGYLTGRSLKTHANKHVTEYFSDPAFAGFDGEMAAAFECNSDLCRTTTSALSTIEGTPWVLWHVFDYLTPATSSLPYLQRHNAMVHRVHELTQTHPHFAEHLKIVPRTLCNNLQELLQCDDMWLDMGYEGTIVRKPEGLHKQGRSTVREGGLLRIKRFIDAEARVLRIIEGQANLNKAQVNELGKQFRSSHQENKVPNGMVGAMECELLDNVVNHAGEVLFQKGQIVTVSAGSMDHMDRLRYFKQQELLLGNVIKFKTFPHGCKDKPRFPVFQTLRSLNDM